MVKETICLLIVPTLVSRTVSIPSRGSGKGDVLLTTILKKDSGKVFQSPLGEVVKETSFSVDRKLFASI